VTHSIQIRVVLPFMLPVRDQLPTRTFPFVNYLLIAANICAFVLATIAWTDGAAPDELSKAWGLVPARLFAYPVVGIETIFTSMFMHAPLAAGGLMHIGFNMLFLWIFGDNVEDALGHLRYLVFYLLGGVGAAAAQVLSDPGSTLPMVGASGAISAVLAAYALLYPRSPITVLDPIPILWLFWGFFVLLPAWLVIGFFFVINLWDALMSPTGGGGVAFMAHVGGFVAGAFLLRLFMSGRERTDDYARWQKWGQRRQPRAW
jgi:membrane associated rhomboid family serine protease